MENLIVKINNMDGKLVVSSRVVAEQLRKEHQDVKKKVKEVLKFGTEYFPFQIKVRGKQAEDFMLTKDGFILLCMNYTGYNEFKRAYINKFNDMEKQIANNINPKQNLLLSIIQSETEVERAVALNKYEIEYVKPLEVKAEYHDAVLKSDKLITVTNIAKDLGMSAIKLNSILHDLKIQYKKSDTWVLYEKYQNKVPEYCDYLINEHGQQLKWTEKGRKWIIELLKENNIII